ncbi:MarR family transcriptional regulator [Micromonospora sp. WMMA1363]|uniref:MarR family winged helix-turn-helix transcriptional regulator n=1 Tax=Micromonospora sp. WMMA1363 TaxID=3053985 RepID=UPI00259CC0EC|nr:MarR family transcriptional regulator [Micromonospora sp. WMMA1363]MDM4719955.1 MarR family transcriptional regulator [Micromonospora sp. WMMA1363]
MTDDLVLRRQVCFALYAASRALTDVYRPILDGFGLTYPQYLVLLVLGEYEEPPTVSVLGERLHLDSGTLSPLLKRLAAAGLVARRRSAADERRVVVELTAQGRALRGRLADVPQAVTQATGLTAADLVELRDTLTRLTETIHRQKEQ